jgi:hypothetical protein
LLFFYWGYIDRKAEGTFLHYCIFEQIAIPLKHKTARQLLLPGGFVLLKQLIAVCDTDHHGRVSVAAGSNRSSRDFRRADTLADRKTDDTVHHP